MNDTLSGAVASLAVAAVPTIWFVAFQATTAHPLTRDIVATLGLSLLVYMASLSFVLFVDI